MQTWKPRYILISGHWLVFNTSGNLRVQPIAGIGDEGIQEYPSN